MNRLSYLFCLLCLGACSFFSAPEPLVKQTAPLDVPPDLSSPQKNGRFAIPPEGRASRDSPLSAQASLPPLFLLESKGSRDDAGEKGIWLSVKSSQKQVFEEAKRFFLDQRWVIAQEIPFEFLETDWRTDKARGQERRERFRLRLQSRGKNTWVKTEHVAMVKKGSVWQPAPPDPEQEGELVLVLRQVFGKQLTQVTEHEPLSPSVSARTDKGGMLFDAAFDTSWEVLGDALRQAGFEILDHDRKRGYYTIREPRKKGWLKKTAFWHKDEPPQEVILAMAQEGEASCRVRFLDSGESPLAPSIWRRFAENIMEHL